VMSGMLSIVFGTSKETSDFIVDALELWWTKNHDNFKHINELVINLDNGPAVNSHRTQFIRRLREFANQTGLSIRLVYYPPYHSKYNPIERTWAALEKHWNGEILNSVKKTVNWAKTMTWKGLNPFVYLLRKTYHKGISPSKEEVLADKERIQRSGCLPKWDVRIEPVRVGYFF
jgi:transposase